MTQQVRLRDGTVLDLRPESARLDDEPIPLSPSQLALLHRLSAQPGEVVSREALLAALPGTAKDLHAVEVTMSRLRLALGRPDVVQTVIKRGYRLNVLT
jgi:uroporphyrinogen-III synthase